MSLNVGVGRLVGLVCLATLGASDPSLFAQQAPPLDAAIAPPVDGPGSSAERVDRSRLTHPELRANAVDPNTGQPVDPRIEALLKEWSERTKEIKRLQGRHLRSTRNFEWGNESWAEGQFYVETPDRGRIDVRPYSTKLPDPEKVKPRRNPNGRFVKLNIVRDSKHERWICDGKEIKVINDDDKTYDAVKIPPNQRGANIMDGPLPFLFGMPPDKAKARYQFKLLAENDKAYAIQVRPNWKQDAVDWSQADVLLDRKTCLPREVHLHNAAGTQETVYMFRDLQVNRIRFFFWTDPFDPALTFYKRSVHNTPPAGPGGPAGSAGDPLAANRMPSLIGLPFKSVEQKLKSLGYNVQRPVRGDPAKAPEQVFCVQKQEPPADAPLDQKTPIVLTLYVRMDSDQAQQNVQPTSHSDYRNDGTYGGASSPDGPRTVAKPSGP